MNFRIADTFTDSLAKLTGEEQKAVKTTAFDLQLNPASPGMSFHKLDKARDKNFWSVRVSSDIRLIVHRTEHSLLLCYVDHHDKAYEWAERRKLETHPKTGAAQLVEIRETVQEIVVPVTSDASSADAPTAAEAAAVRASVRRRAAGLRCAGGVAGRRAQATKTACWSSPTICPPRRPRRCWIWPRAARRASASPLPRRRARSSIPDAQRRFRVMTQRRGAGARAGLSRGRSGRSFSTPRSASGWSATTAARRASPARRVRARPSSRLHRAVFLARSIPKPACC